MRLRGQASLEYLMIIGIFLGIFVLVYASTFATSNNTIRSAHAIQAVQKIAVAADNLYKLGGGKQTIFVQFPAGISSSTVQNKVIGLSVQISGGGGDAISVTTSPINGTLPISEGLQKITLEVVNGTVQIS